MSEIKILECSVEGCSNMVQASKFASPKSIKCDACKRVQSALGKEEGGTSVIKTVAQKVAALPTKVEIIRNRQEIEAIINYDDGTVISRIPVEIKKFKNQLDYLSVSKMDTYERCPLKFNKVYMNSAGSLDDDTGNIFTWFGSILHEVAEIAERDYFENGVIPNVLELYDTAWRKRPLTDIVMYKEGRELILHYFKEHPVGSAYYSPIIIDITGKTAIEIEWRGQLGEVPEFGCMFDYIGWYDINGFRITTPYDQLSDEAFENIVGVVRDYKTNRHPYTTYDLENSLQLATYEIIARIMFPKIKYWRSGYELFRFGWQECPERTADDLEATQAYINNLWYQITHDNSWRAKLNPFCGYCEERTTCDKYCEFVNNPKVMIDTIHTSSGKLEEIEAQRENVNAMYKILGDRKSELENIVKLAVEQATLTGSKIVIGGQELYLQSQNRPSYDYSSTRNILAMHGKINELDKCLSINKTKMDAIAKSDPQLSSALKGCLISSYTSPYLMKKKTK